MIDARKNAGFTLDPVKIGVSVSGYTPHLTCTAQHSTERRQSVRELRLERRPAASRYNKEICVSPRTKTLSWGCAVCGGASRRGSNPDQSRSSFSRSFLLFTLFNWVRFHFYSVLRSGLPNGFCLPAAFFYDYLIVIFLSSH